MSFFIEGRLSDSPSISMAWQGQAGHDYASLYPADEHWRLLLLKNNESVKISAEGPIIKARLTTHAEGVEWLIIQFEPGVPLPTLPVNTFVDTETVLSLTTRTSFRLHGSTW